MSSPSSARVHGSSSRIRSSKRDANPSASRSRIFGASSVSNSSRIVNGTAAPSGGKSSARVYLDGADVTPQSLLVSRIKPSTAEQQQRGRAGKGKGGTRNRNAHGVGASTTGASVMLSQDHFSTSSIDDSDSDAPPSSSTSQKGITGSTATSKAASTKLPTGSGGVAAPVGATGLAAAPATGPGATTAAAPEDDDGVSGDVDKSVDVVAAPKAIADIGPIVSTTLVANAPTKVVKKTRRPVTVVLVETPTEMLFELRSLCVAQDATFHQAVTQRNRQYVDMCAAKKGSDKFVDGRSQTLQLAQKTKEVMTAPPATRDSACMATDWDIFDCVRVDDDSAMDHDDANAMDATSGSGNNNNHKTKTPGEQGENGEFMLKQQVLDIVDATMVSPGCVLDVDGDIVDDLRARQKTLRHARKHRHGHSNTNSNSQKSRVFHHSSGANTHSSLDYNRSNATATSGSSMASPSQSSGNVSLGASQDIVGVGGSGGGGEDSSNSIATSQIGLSGGASQVLSNGSNDGKQNQNAYARANTNVDMGLTIAQQRTAKVLASASLLQTVSVVERAVQQNVFHHQHVLYRNFPSLTPAMASALDPLRQEKVVTGHPHDWRSTIGFTKDPTDAPATSSMVPPIGSFNTAASSGSGGFGSSLTERASTSKPGLEKLWAFQCSLTEGRTVTCLAWNKVNEDLLAVAYARTEVRPACPSAAAIGGTPAAATTQPANAGTGVADSTSADDGLVLFWSLKNPEFPERIYNLDVGVTSIDFSCSHPYMLAVGFANGVVAIYDTRKDEAPLPSLSPSLLTLNAAKPVSSGPTTANRPMSASGSGDATTTAIRRHVPVADATSETSGGKHLDVVWQVKWISKGLDRGENVVSISSDGRVTEWSLKKGLSFSDLMTLKRVANPLLGSDARADGGVISRQASGHCIDFAPNDPSVYYVGTEDGMIHKCSVSYNEQYLQTYVGHTGPVYQIVVSPFSSDLFLSCSADWNVKLWHQADQRDALSFHSVNLQHAVLGISWCPSDATIFGAVTEDGRIEIWDLQHSSLDPIITHYPKKFAAAPPAPARLSNSNRASMVVAGDSGYDALDDLATRAKDKDAEAAAALSPPCVIPLECTKIAFAPSAPVIVVGDSTGDVTVYRVPALTEGTRAGDGVLSVDEQVARLHRVLHPNNQEG